MSSGWKSSQQLIISYSMYRTNGEMDKRLRIDTLDRGRATRGNQRDFETHTNHKRIVA